MSECEICSRSILALELPDPIVLNPCSLVLGLVLGIGHRRIPWARVGDCSCLRCGIHCFSIMAASEIQSKLEPNWPHILLSLVGDVGNSDY